MDVGRLRHTDTFNRAVATSTTPNVLETVFQAEHGTLTLTDFMPLADEAYRGSHLTPDHAIVRLLRCESGTVDVDIHFSPRPNFGLSKTKLVDRGKLGFTGKQRARDAGAARRREIYHR